MSECNTAKLEAFLPRTVHVALLYVYLPAGRCFKAMMQYSGDIYRTEEAGR